MACIKWHGGKSYLAERIIALMPPRCKKPNAPASNDPGWLHYVEPYFGGGAALLANDPEGISEVVNDKNGELMNFWRTLQDPASFELMRRRLEATPFSHPEFVRAGTSSQDPVERACAFFVRCRQSHSGRMQNFTGITKTRTRRQMNNEVSAWLTCVEGLPEVHARLKRVLILNDEALNVIRQQDGPRTLFYLDPPYLHETRASTTEYGAHEMTEDQHRQLLEVLAGIEGRFLLSGYRSALYERYEKAHGWARHEFQIANHSSGAKAKPTMVECVWTNFCGIVDIRPGIKESGHGMPQLKGAVR